MPSAGGIRAGKAYVELYADNSKLVAGMKVAEAKLITFAARVSRAFRSIERIGSKLQTLGASLTRLATYGFAPIAASLAAIWKTADPAFKATQDRLKGMWAEIRAPLMRLADAVTRALLPLFEKLTKALGPFLDRLACFVQQNPRIIEAFTRWIAVLATAGVTAKVAGSAVVSLSLALQAIAAVGSTVARTVFFPLVKGLEELGRVKKDIVGVSHAVYQLVTTPAKYARVAPGGKTLGFLSAAELKEFRKQATEAATDLDAILKEAAAKANAAAAKDINIWKSVSDVMADLGVAESPQETLVNELRALVQVRKQFIKELDAALDAYKELAEVKMLPGPRLQFQGDFADLFGKRAMHKKILKSLENDLKQAQAKLTAEMNTFAKEMEPAVARIKVTEVKYIPGEAMLVRGHEWAKIIWATVKGLNVLVGRIGGSVAAWYQYEKWIRQIIIRTNSLIDTTAHWGVVAKNSYTAFQRAFASGQFELAFDIIALAWSVMWNKMKLVTTTALNEIKEAFHTLGSGTLLIPVKVAKAIELWLDKHRKKLGLPSGTPRQQAVAAEEAHYAAREKEIVKTEEERTRRLRLAEADIQASQLERMKRLPPGSAERVEILGQFVASQQRVNKLTEEEASRKVLALQIAKKTHLQRLQEIAADEKLIGTVEFLEGVIHQIPKEWDEAKAAREAALKEIADKMNAAAAEIARIKGALNVPLAAAKEEEKPPILRMLETQIGFNISRLLGWQAGGYAPLPANTNATKENTKAIKENTAALRTLPGGRQLMIEAMPLGR